MAETLASVVLRVVDVARDVVNGLERVGSNPAYPTSAMLFPRHPMPEKASDPSEDGRGLRAGRPRAGVPTRGLAITARPAILSGWSRSGSFLARRAERRKSPGCGKAQEIPGYPQAISQARSCADQSGHQGMPATWDIEGHV